MENLKGTAAPTAPKPGNGAPPPPAGSPPGPKVDKLSVLKQINADGTLKPAEKPVEGAAAEGATELKDGEQPSPAGPKDPIEKELDDLLPSEGSLVTEVEVGGKKVPVMDALKDAVFEVPFKGGSKTVNGIEQLYRLAGQGFAATERNLAAKNVVTETQKIFDQWEKEKPALVKKGVQETIGSMFAGWEKGVLEGRWPGGQPIPTVQLQSQAVRDLQVLKGWFTGTGTGPPESATPAPGQPQNLEELKAQLQAEFDQKLEEQVRKQQEGQRNQQSAQATLKVLDEVVKPYAQKFLKSDGKTVNGALYGHFVQDTQLLAADMAERVIDRYPNGMSAEVQKAIIRRAAAETLKNYGVTAPPPAKDPKNEAPALKPGSGAPAPKVPQKGPAKRDPMFGTPEWFKNKREKLGIKA